MKPSEDQKLLEMVKSMGEIYGRQGSVAAALMFLSDMDDYLPEEISAAMQKCRKEMRTFPTVADIISRIPNGHPGPEEAWALIPKDENSSAVLTEEMATAWVSVLEMVQADKVAARMAFREIYSKLISESSDSRSPPKWFPSLGHDPAMRDQALNEAVRKGQISQDRASALLGGSTVKRRLEIAGPVEAPDLTPLAKIMEQISGVRTVPGASRQILDMSPSEFEDRKALLRAQAARIAKDEASG